MKDIPVLLEVFIKDLSEERAENSIRHDVTRVKERHNRAQSGDVYVRYS